MNIQSLRYVITLAEELHFGRAALRLAITQPALSQQLTQLEADLDARLFDRHPRVALTPVGAALVDHARRILASVAEAEAEARSLANLTRRRIRLGYLEYWNPPFLARAMRALRELDPPVVLESRNLYSAEVLTGLRDRSLEIGFVHLPVDDDRLTVRPLLEGRWSLVMPRTHPLARRSELTRIGTEAARRVAETGEPVKLSAMSPFERKVVHDAVAAAGLTSESEGVEPRRRVVVLPPSGTE